LTENSTVQVDQEATATTSKLAGYQANSKLSKKRKSSNSLYKQGE
jgi:hypothetical protein